MMYNKNQEIHLKFPQSNIMDSFSYHVIIQPYAVPKSGNTLESKTSKAGIHVTCSLFQNREDKIHYLYELNNLLVQYKTFPMYQSRLCEGLCTNE